MKEKQEGKYDLKKAFFGVIILLLAIVIIPQISISRDREAFKKDPTKELERVKDYMAKGDYESSESRSRIFKGLGSKEMYDIYSRASIFAIN